VSHPPTARWSSSVCRMPTSPTSGWSPGA